MTSIIYSKTVKQLVHLRMVSIAIQVTAILSAAYGFSVQLPLLPMSGVLGVYLLVNLATYWWCKGHQAMSCIGIFCHLVIDCLALTLLLYFSGGPANPFTGLYILPVMVAVSLLPAQYVWGIVLVSAISYMLLIPFHHPFELSGIDIHHHGMHSHNTSAIDLHLYGMVVSFLIMAGVAAFFGVRMASDMRKQDEAFHQLQEHAQAQGYLFKLGMMAAGAAHHMGTPLATLTMLKEQWQNQATSHSNAAEFTQQLAIMDAQINRCSEAIRNIQQSVSQKEELIAAKTLPLFEGFNALLEAWHTTQPQCILDISYKGNGKEEAAFSPSLEMAVVNILDNAVRVSPGYVQCIIESSEEHALCIIRDRGPGFSDEQLKQQHHSMRASQQHNQERKPLGLLFTRLVMQELGGNMECSNHEEGGGNVRLQFPAKAFISKSLRNDYVEKI